MPQGTWPVVLEVLGEDLLSTLLATSAASMRRYREGQRATPGPVAHRLHFLALLLADLAGAYNEYGIRRWFVRPRQRLDGRSPMEVLGSGFDPYGPDAARVRALVDALQASGAA